MPSKKIKSYDKRAKDIKAKKLIGQEGFELEPRCMPPKEKDSERRQQVAVTNRGQLVPCCWMDQREVLRHPDMQTPARILVLANSVLKSSAKSLVLKFEINHAIE